MANAIEKYKNDVTMLYKRGSAAANELYGEVSQGATKAYGYISGNIVVITKELKENAKTAIAKEYTSKTMIILFVLPYIGNIFWALKEIDYSQKMSQAETPEDKVRIIQLKNELIKCHITALTIKTVCYVAMGFLFPAITVVNLLLVGGQFLRLAMNEEGLKKFEKSEKEHEVALAF